MSPCAVKHHCINFAYFKFSFLRNSIDCIILLYRFNFGHDYSQLVHRICIGTTMLQYNPHIFNSSIRLTLDKINKTTMHEKNKSLNLVYVIAVKYVVFSQNECLDKLTGT